MITGPAGLGSFGWFSPYNRNSRLWASFMAQLYQVFSGVRRRVGNSAPGHGGEQATGTGGVSGSWAGRGYLRFPPAAGSAQHPSSRTSISSMWWWLLLPPLLSSGPPPLVLPQQHFPLLRDPFDRFLFCCCCCPV